MGGLFGNGFSYDFECRLETQEVDGVVEKSTPIVDALEMVSGLYPRVGQCRYFPVEAASELLQGCQEEKPRVVTQQDVLGIGRQHIAMEPIQEFVLYLHGRRVGGQHVEAGEEGGVELVELVDILFGVELPFGVAIERDIELGLFLFQLAQRCQHFPHRTAARCVGKEHDVGGVRNHFAERFHVGVLSQGDFDKIAFLLQECFLDEVEVTVLAVFYVIPVEKERFTQMNSV